jgi:cell division protein FtsB
MAAKTKHRNTRQRGRKQSRRVSKRKKQCGGARGDESEQLKTQRLQQHKELARAFGVTATKLEAKIAELEADKARLEAKVAELEAKVTEFEADKARLAQADLLKPDNHPINNPDRQRWTKLCSAAYENNPDTIEQLLSDGANPNLAGTPRGRTPVMVAACRGYLPLVKQLVAGGADLTIADEQGGTPFACAEKMKHVETSAWISDKVDLKFIQARR